MQDRAVEYLIYLERRQAATTLIDSIRIAALHTGGFDTEALQRVFPDMFPPDPFAKAKKEDGTYDIDQVDDELIEWSVPPSLDVDDDISRWIEERSQMSLTAADLSDPDDEGWR